ncbi:MAG: hypothetical protein WA667_30650 [Candidatus Nitrosopolaris sp.]
MKEAWTLEQAAMGNSTLPTICDKLNIMASIHNRKLIVGLARELNQRTSVIDKLEERIMLLEDQLKQIKGKRVEEEGKTVLPQGLQPPR